MYFEHSFSLVQILVLHITTQYTLAYLQLFSYWNTDVYYSVCVCYSSPLLLYYIHVNSYQGIQILAVSLKLVLRVTTESCIHRWKRMDRLACWTEDEGQLFLKTHHNTWQALKYANHLIFFHILVFVLLPVWMSIHMYIYHVHTAHILLQLHVADLN